jgi:hypothetical protein
MTAEEINSFFSNWFKLSENERKESIKELNKIGNLVTIAPRSDKQTGHCPIWKQPIAKPCGLSKCSFYISSPASMNCAISCLGDVKGAKLPPSEVALLLSLTSTETNKLTDSAIKKIQIALIKDKIEESNLPKFQYLQGHCVSCGCPIKDQLESEIRPDLSILDKKFGWCVGPKKDPMHCKNKTPLWKFLLEYNFGCHWSDVIAIALCCLKKQEIVAEALDLHREIINKNWQEVQNSIDEYLTQ